MIYTWSKFNYGHTVSLTNKYILFSEGAGELIATIEEGNYSLGGYVSAVQDALNATGALDYIVSVDRAGSNTISISASGVFSLLTNTGTLLDTSAFSMMGFSYASANLTGADNYDGNMQSGSVYSPQFLLQSYVPPENFLESVNPVINESGDGRVEVIRFGTKNKIEMDLKFITDLPMDGLTIRNNPAGLSSALAFLNYITQKKKFEFVPDIDTPDTFSKVILESYPSSNDGTGFKLKELFADGLPDVYETGVITLRVVA